MFEMVAAPRIGDEGVRDMHTPQSEASGYMQKETLELIEAERTSMVKVYHKTHVSSTLSRFPLSAESLITVDSVSAYSFRSTTPGLKILKCRTH